MTDVVRLRLVGRHRERALQAADLVGWGFVLWSRLQRIKARAVSLHETAKSPFYHRKPAGCYSPSGPTVSGRNNSSGAVTRGKKRMSETDRHPSTLDTGEPENLKSLRDSQFILRNSAKGGDNGSDKGGAGRPDKTLLYARARGRAKCEVGHSRKVTIAGATPVSVEKSRGSPCSVSV